MVVYPPWGYLVLFPDVFGTYRNLLLYNSSLLWLNDSNVIV